MARGKGGLGRGLDSLFEDAAPVFESEHAAVETLPLREIEPDPDQPRKTFEQETLSELAASIAEHGLLQPIAVRPRPMGGYSIVAGERRWRASRMAGLTEVPVVIKDVSDEQAMELALVENLQREDLDPVEEAAGIRELMTRCDLTQEQAARKLGKSRSALANSLRLLNLPETVLELLKSGFINTGHAKVVLGLPTPELQAEAAQIIADNQLNVRQAEALCKKMAKPAKEPREPAPRGTLPVEVEESLKQVLGSEVNVAYHGGKGKLTVHFYSDEQLPPLNGSGKPQAHRCKPNRVKESQSCWISNLSARTRTPLRKTSKRSFRTPSCRWWMRSSKRMPSTVQP